MNKTFACPHCKQKLTASPEMAGALVDCPACGQMVRIPALGDPTPTQNAVQPYAPPQQMQQSYATPPQYPPQQMQPIQQTYAPPQMYPNLKRKMVASLRCLFPPSQYPPQQMQPIQQPYATPPQYPPQQMQPIQQTYAPPQMYSNLKRKMVASLLCLFLGIYGGHRFYLGHVGSAVAQLLLGVFGQIFYVVAILLGGEEWFLIAESFLSPVSIWVIVDLILILCGRLKDSKGQPLV